jgi:hypothetical protein
MHTYEDAMLLTGRNLRDVGKAENITDVGRLVAKHAL